MFDITAECHVLGTTELWCTDLIRGLLLVVFPSNGHISTKCCPHDLVTGYLGGKGEHLVESGVGGCLEFQWGGLGMPGMPTISETMRVGLLQVWRSAKMPHRPDPTSQTFPIRFFSFHAVIIICIYSWLEDKMIVYFVVTIFVYSYPVQTNVS